MVSIRGEIEVDGSNLIGRDTNRPTRNAKSVVAPAPLKEMESNDGEETPSSVNRLNEKWLVQKLVTRLLPSQVMELYSPLPGSVTRIRSLS